MDAKEQPKVAQQTKGASRINIIIILILLVIVACGLLYYAYTLREQNKTLTEEKADLTNDNVQLKDTVTKMQEQVDQQIKQINDLNAQVKYKDEELANKAQQLKNALYQTKISKEEVEKLKKQLEQLTAEVENYKKEIDELKSKNQELTTSNENLNKAKQENEKKINELSTITEDLSKKVTIASILKADQIYFNAVDSKGKRKITSEFRSKKTNKIEVCFNIQENPIAPTGNKEAYVIFYNPDGSASKDFATGGGNFKLATGEDKIYTVKKTLNYNRTSQQVCMIRTRGEQETFAPGKHTVEIYSDGYKIGEASFMVK